MRAVAYVDLFDYPLKPAEVHRYLPAVAARRDLVLELLQGELASRLLSRRDGYFMLAGREEIAETRRRRERVARELWPKAVEYGRLMGDLPFVRMVAVTGSVAANNADDEADIDYLLVTANDRLWLARLFVVAIVRLATRRGVHLCPNYLVSERAMCFEERNLYTARELAQMVPVAGKDLYREMWHINRWAADWLPNAQVQLPAAASERGGPLRRPTRTLAERVLRTRIGAQLERWEMQRKVARFSSRSEGEEVRFSGDWCKGHFEGHAERILQAYQARLRELKLEIEDVKVAPALTERTPTWRRRR